MTNKFCKLWLCLPLLSCFIILIEVIVIVFEHLNNTGEIDLEDDTDCATDYCFSLFDDDACRENYSYIESSYNSSYQYYMTSKQELNSLYADIFTGMQTYDIDLVDNSDFLDWCMSHVSPEADCGGDNDENGDMINVRCWGDGTKVVLESKVREKFLTTDGATPLEDIDALIDAMETMYWFRTNNGLEVNSMVACRRYLKMAAGAAMYWDLSGCTEETRQQAEELQTNTHRGVDTSANLMNMRSFLTATAFWITDTYA